ncbi:MAG TPA: GntR family transcriptional regulator [Candidatus Limnocylindria bacterium]|nr:GntR family transcriptional regulator [Candidatus Limnocylindria bacterium]
MTVATAEGSDPPLARSVLSAQVKDKMLQWILEGQLRPGARIIETRVARELGTSQAPVREALRDLATLGLVEMHPYRGARVREPAPDELVEAMEVRGELEAMAARSAVRRITDADLERLEAILEGMRASAARGDAHAQAIQNLAFHTHVVSASGNLTIQRLWTMLEPFARSYLTATVPGADLVWLAERHAAVVEALRSGDPDRAAEAMRVHAREAESQVLRGRHPLGTDATAASG